MAISVFLDTKERQIDYSCYSKDSADQCVAAKFVDIGSDGTLDYVIINKKDRIKTNGATASLPSSPFEDRNATPEELDQFKTHFMSLNGDAMSVYSRLFHSIKNNEIEIDTSCKNPRVYPRPFYRDGDIQRFFAIGYVDAINPDTGFLQLVDHQRDITFLFSGSFFTKLNESRGIDNLSQSLQSAKCKKL